MHFAALRAVAQQQYGVVSREQVTAAGMSRRAVDRLLATGQWLRPHPGVYSLATPHGEVERWFHDAFAGALWLGDEAALSRDASARLWKLDGFDDSPPEFSTTSRKRSASLIVHEVAELNPEDVRLRRKLRVTSVERTLIDLAATTSGGRLTIALESALRMRLTTERRIARRLARADATRGKRTLHTLLERGSLVATESEPETLLWLAILERGLPVPERQYVVRSDDGAFVGRFDFAYPDARLLVEVDGYRHHSKLDDWLRDRAKQNAAVDAGWRVIRFPAAEIRDRPDEVCESIARQLSRS